MAKEWDNSRCNEKSGFLFNHECFQPPVATCDRCQKPVCAEHSHMFGSSDRICTSCAKKRDRGGRGGKRTPTTGTSRSSRSDHYDDHYNAPYFYGGYYFGSTYHDGHHGAMRNDPNDFTEADAASLSSEMDEGFENDMSES